VTEANLRAMASAPVVAIKRDPELITNPESHTVLCANDLLGLVGDEEQLNAAQKVLAIFGNDRA
jgi:CPA2 family monovalent cation:H+ antiporter-2